MKEKLFDFFESLDKEPIKNNMKLNDKNIKDTITQSFVNGPFVEIIGDSKREYRIEFVDLDENKIIHESVITSNHWTKANRQWFTNWKINIFNDNNLIYSHEYNAKDKKVYVHLSSESIGDTLAWFPYVEEFRKKHNCKMICSTFHNYLFEGKYKDIEFVKPGTTVHDLYAMYEIGIYDGNFDRNRNDHKIIPLQQAASDILGLEFKEVRPDINVRKSDSNKIPGKYVVIATESTAQCKLWNYTGGWQKVVDYLNKIGYKVVVVQKEKTDLKNVIHKVGNKNLEVAIDIINGAEFFIGISSGLSWIAWALQKKVVMISGFTAPWYEFNENCYRINNIHSCKGCWHEHIFDKGDWNWCPMKKNFECSSTILPEAVFAQVQTIILKLDEVYTMKSANKLVNLTNNAIGFEFHNSKFGDAESMYYEIFRSRMYDFNECKVGHGDIVLDIGANIGIFTRYAIANGARHVYAFEPIKENYDILIKNSLDATTYNIGITDSRETGIFHIDSTSGGHTILDVNANNSNTTEIREVQCVSLDYLFQQNLIPSSIDFVKIDTEGAEIKILEGLSDDNALKTKKIVMEWHQFLFSDKDLVNKITTRFSNLGFKFYIDHIGNDLMTIYLWRT